jgi:hypothetical protein
MDTLCPVCREPLLSSSISGVLNRHLTEYLFRIPLCTEKALTSYRECAQWKGLTHQIPVEILEWWKGGGADIGMETYHARCGHLVHVRCASQCADCNGKIEKNNSDAAIPLPKVVQWSDEKEYKCPVCQVTVPFTVYDSYKRNHNNTGTIGLYQLQKGAVVWFYEHEYQPGHLQSGSIGRLIHRDGDTDTLLISRIPGEQECRVPMNRVFDIAFLSSTGIPTREQVGLVSVMCDVSSMMKVTSDHRGLALLRDREQYVDSVLSSRDSLEVLIHKHWKTTVSTLLPYYRKSLYFWDSFIVPRLSSGKSRSLIQPRHDSSISYDLMEEIHEQESTPSLTSVSIICDFLVCGYICNDTSAPRVQKYLSISGVLPLENRHPLPDWATQLQLTSCTEVGRIKAWCKKQWLVESEQKMYWIRPGCHKNTFCKSRDFHYLCEVNEEENDTPTFFGCTTEWLPVLYKQSAVARDTIDDLRDTI